MHNIQHTVLSFTNPTYSGNGMRWPCNIIAYKRKFCVMFHLHSNYVHVIYYKQSSEDKLLHAMEKGSQDMLSQCLMI